MTTKRDSQSGLTAISCKTLRRRQVLRRRRATPRRARRDRAWTLAFTSPTTGRRREIGLGKLEDVGLAKARKDAAEFRDAVRKGVDPIAAKAERIAAGRAEEVVRKAAERGAAATLRRVARQYHEAEVEPKLKHAKESARWIAAIEQHVPPEILDRPIATIEAADLLDALRPIYLKVPETARRIRQRLDAVFDDAVLRKLAPTNPTKIIARKLRTKRTGSNWRALPFAETPALVKRLRALPGTSARAMEFAILTAARTGEVLEMEWGELSKDGRTWTVPAARMKAGEAHVVDLSDARARSSTASAATPRNGCFARPSATRRCRIWRC